MNIVFGGAFNPLTIAHIEIVELLLNKYEDSKVIILPVGNDYNKPTLIDFNYRYEMLKIAFNNNPRVIISTLEHDFPFNGTINSLNELSKTYSNLYFVTGADNIIKFKTWIEYEKLLSSYPFIFVTRRLPDENNNIKSINVEDEMKQYSHLNVKYELLKYNTNVNSSEFRSNPKHYNSYVSKDIFNYILKNKLYGVDQNV